MVNRLSVSAYTTWGAQVYELIQQTAPVSIHLAANVDAETRRLVVDAEMMAVDGTVTGKLQLWLIEDGIVSAQLMPDGSSNRDYVHNHVFRTSINGTWGEDISIPEGESITRQSAITINDGYVLDNLSVVAFVYNNAGVLQAAIVPLTP